VPRDLIIEADGGSRGNPGPAAYGALVRDAQSGAVLAELGGSLGTATNNVAEYNGAIAGLNYVAQLDPDARVEVRLDSKLVVEQMSGRWQIKHPDMRELAKEARSIMPAGQVTYVWVPREQNSAADSLANEILDSFDGTTPITLRRTIDPSLPGSLDEDLLGSVQELYAREVTDAALSKSTNVMIGWADLGTPVTTHMARHGASVFSLEKRFSGSGGLDVPLAPLGIQQAQALASEVARRNEVTAIIASPLLRTQQTAQFVSAAIGLPIVTMPEFAEAAFGDWDGCTFSEVSKKWPEQLREWLAGTDIAPPGGESFAHVRDRVEQGRREVLDRFAGEHVLIVSHVTPIKIMTSTAIGAPLDALFKMELPPCSLSKLAWFPDGNSSMFSFAESGHLHGLVVDGA
jgi:ribonuclease H / adenosylcobalamin/alpha-ribazole phosphatase